MLGMATLPQSGVETLKVDMELVLQLTSVDSSTSSLNTTAYSKKNCKKEHLTAETVPDHQMLGVGEWDCSSNKKAATATGDVTLTNRGPIYIPSSDV